MSDGSDRTVAGGERARSAYALEGEAASALERERARVLEGERAAAPRASVRFGEQRDHWPYASASLVVLLLTLVWRVRTSRSEFEDFGQWWIGVAAAALLLICCAFIVRKRSYGTRLGHLRPYYLAHVWGGFTWGLVVFVHADGRARGLFFSTLAAVAMMTWLSGLLGPLVHQVMLGVTRHLEGSPGLLDDLEIARARVAGEIHSLVSSLPPEHSQLAAAVSRAPRGVVAVMRLWREPHAAERTLRSSLASIAQYRPPLSDDRTVELTRVAEDTIELWRLEAQIMLHRARGWWLTLHTVLTAPLLVLTLVHILVVIWY